MPNIQYIADHIDRIERRHRGNESLIEGLIEALTSQIRGQIYASRSV